MQNEMNAGISNIHNMSSLSAWWAKCEFFCFLNMLHKLQLVLTKQKKNYNKN